MKMIYYAGLGVGFEHPQEIDLSNEKILSWEIRKLKGWNSPNLIILFESKKFEQPVGLIVNYKDVVRWLKKENKSAVVGSGIDWQYFFGGSSGRTFDRYYKAEINGIRIEKHASHHGVKYAIGNINEAKKKFKTEAELLEALSA
jgi:hypothetical protein